MKKLTEQNKKLSLDYINKCRERNMKQYNPREDQDIKDLDFYPATLKEVSQKMTDIYGLK